MASIYSKVRSGVQEQVDHTPCNPWCKRSQGIRCWMCGRLWIRLSIIS